MKKGGETLSSRPSERIAEADCPTDICLTTLLPTSVFLLFYTLFFFVFLEFLAARSVHSMSFALDKFPEVDQLSADLHKKAFIRLRDDNIIFCLQLNILNLRFGIKLF